MVYKEFNDYRLSGDYRQIPLPKSDFNDGFECFEYCIQDSECVASTIKSPEFNYCYLYKSINSSKEEGWVSVVKKPYYNQMPN